MAVEEEFFYHSQLIYVYAIWKCFIEDALNALGKIHPPDGRHLGFLKRQGGCVHRFSVDVDGAEFVVTEWFSVESTLVGAAMKADILKLFW